MRFSLFLLGCVLLGLAGTLLTGGVAHADVTLSDFNNQWDFGWDYDGFVSTPGPSSNRIQDPLDGYGGSGKWLGSADLSGDAGSYLAIDLTANASNQVDSFLLQMTDTSGVNAQWEFNTSSLTPGALTRLVATAPMSSPHYGDNGHGGPDHYKDFDLTQVQSWQIQGEWGSPYPVDLSFDNIEISSTVVAPEAYAGRSANAAWRSEAATRIDAVRKEDLSVTVTDALGVPIPNATVNVAMLEHEFRFGSKVPMSALNGSGSLNGTYREKLLEMFNTVQPQDFGWQAWEGEANGSSNATNALNSLDWAEAQGLSTYGHVYVWPGDGHIPSAVQAKVDEFPTANAARQNQLRNEIGQSVLSHISEKGALIAGKVDWMNVVNELRNNRVLLDILGDDVVADWFVAAQNAAPGMGLHINEQKILATGGGVDTNNQRGYYEWIESLLDDGAPVTGIGMQSHFTAGSLTGPEEIWTILDRFGELGLDMAVTEFDFDTVDQQLQADFTRDFLTAIFAHEGMDAFLMWDFSEWFHWRRDASMYDFGWNLKPNGQAFRDLVLSEWWTDESLDADALGEAQLRAFKGKHEVEAAFAEFEESLEVTLSDDGLDLLVALPFLLGDFDRNGVVDSADYTVWRDTLDQSVTPGAGADGNGDGLVTLDDLEIWKSRFGSVLPTEQNAASTPEPSSLVALLTAMCLAVASRRAS